MNDKRKDTQEKDLFEPNSQRIEETPLELPKVFMEGDSPSQSKNSSSISSHHLG